MPVMKTPLICALLLTLFTVAGCGFQLRGAANLPYDTLHVAAAPTSTFATQLRRAVTSGSQTKVVANPKEAQATLHVLGEVREKSILSLSGGGRVREYQLRYRLQYRVADKDNKELPRRPPSCCIVIFRSTTPTRCRRNTKRRCCIATCRPTR